MRRLIGVVVIICVACVGAAQELVSYDIEVELDPASHRVRGFETVRWTNTSSEPVEELWFHLYLNAFANSKSTFMGELGSTSLRGQTRGGFDWGWIRCTSIVSDSGTELLPNLRFASPDDGNEDDRTVAVVELAEAVQPGGVAILEIAFEAQLPEVIARTGHAGEFHMVGQWYPKLGVLEDEGWNCHQFHATSEFYADFADYEVTITVPEGWLVACSGIEIAKSQGQGESAGKAEYLFRAQRVHDVAWSAAPDTMMNIVEADFDPMIHVPPEWHQEAVGLLGVSPAELQLPPMSIRLMLPTQQEALQERMLRAARLAIAWFGLYFGPYPYPQLTIVSPPPAAAEAAGMEYPTLVTTGASRVFEYPPLQWFGFIETVTVHEFGHQYFQGILASNEFEYAWLDEGMTTWAESSCLEDIRRHDLVPELKHGGSWGQNRWSLRDRSLPLRVEQPSWEFRNRGDYWVASYTKAALALKTLEGLLGKPVLYRVMRQYFEDFGFSHPRPEDFFNSVAEVSGRDMNWFFEQAIRGDARADWAVLRVRNRRPRKLEGMVLDTGEWRQAGDQEAQDDAPYRSEVELGRLGDFTGPVAVRISYADGQSEEREWSSRERWVKWTFEGSDRIVAVAVDPEGVWALETKRSNNYWKAETEQETRSDLWWLSDALHLLLTLSPPWS